MRNLFKLIGIIALTTVIGFSVISCGEEEATGKLVISNINSATECSSVYVVGEVTVGETKTIIIAAEEYTVGSPAKPGKVNNNTAILSVWSVDGTAFIEDGSASLIFNFTLADRTVLSGTGTAVLTGGAVLVDFDDIDITIP